MPVGVLKGLGKMIEAREMRSVRSVTPNRYWSGMKKDRLLTSESERKHTPRRYYKSNNKEIGESRVETESGQKDRAAIYRL